MKQIVSRDNATFKALKKLCRSSREREKNRTVVLDGLHLIDSYRQHIGLPQHIIVSQTGKLRPEIVAFIDQYMLKDCGYSVQLTALSDTLFAELSSVETPSGILALVEYPQCQQSPDLQTDTLVLETIQDPGNLGTLLRTAAASGVRQVLLSADCAQIWSPKTLRAAMGAHFLLNLYEKVDLFDFMTHYQGTVMLTTLQATHSVYEVDLKGSIAWVFGNEGQGISGTLLRPLLSAAKEVKIPMPGQTESLNVACAAAVCLFEMVRQRLKS